METSPLLTRLPPSSDAFLLEPAGSTKLTLVSELQVATKQSARFSESGDLFEVYDHGDGYISVVLGDVCGHGPEAAQIASRVRPLLHGCLARGESPGRMLATLNERLMRSGALNRFVTAAAIRIDVLGGLVEIACAGQMGPFVRSASGHVQALNAATGVPLGLLSAESYDEISQTLDSEDVLVLVTDGITDPLSTISDPLGEDSLSQRLKKSPHVTADICEALLADGASARDDATVLVVKLPVRRAARIAA